MLLFCRAYSVIIILYLAVDVNRKIENYSQKFRPSSSLQRCAVFRVPCFVRLYAPERPADLFARAPLPPPARGAFRSPRRSRKVFCGNGAENPLQSACSSSSSACTLDFGTRPAARRRSWDSVMFCAMGSIG